MPPYLARPVGIEPICSTSLYYATSLEDSCEEQDALAYPTGFEPVLTVLETDVLPITLGVQCKSGVPDWA